VDKAEELWLVQVVQILDILQSGVVEEFVIVSIVVEMFNSIVENADSDDFISS
jgi:hypothetical protein